VEFTDVEGDDQTITVSVEGELDAHAAQTFESDALRPFDRRRGAARYVLLGAGLSFVDSSGLRALLRLRDAVVSRGAAFELSNPSEALVRLLELTGLEEAFSRPAAS
jgi:anti-anti-sigma factor